MRKDKVISNYQSWSDFELSTLAGRVFNAMSDTNTITHFPAPDPALPELEVMVTDFIAKHEIASRRGSALEISQKNESREHLLVGLRKLAHHVNGIAQGRTSLLLSTGLVLASAAKRLEVPGITKRIQLRDGRVSGQLRLDFDVVKKAWEYEVELSESDIGDDQVQLTRTFTTTTSRSNVLANVTPGKLYHVRLRARNGQGVGDWSESTSLLAR